jgi:transcriptional regulator with GAF, ATPase, and Fis domain
VSTDARLAALIEINREMMGAAAPRDLLRLVVGSAMRLFDAEGASVALVDAVEHELVFPTVEGEIEGHEIRMPLGRGIVGAVIASGEPAIVNDVRADARFYAGVDRATGFATIAILCAPLRAVGAVIGAIEVINTSQHGGFSKEDVALLEAFAGVAAIAIERTRANERAAAAHRVLRESVDDRYALVAGETPSMREIVDTLRTTAVTRSTVLLLGESGVGKEVLARFVHRASPRADAPFVAVSCAALAPGLLESELFGHEKGAFTGAVAQKKGKFEQAHGGTLFLDEIGELEAPLQAKLLRALQERTIERVGGAREIKVDVRVVAATNRDLRRAMRDGSFREDLYYRLAVVAVDVPPLRARRADVLPLARHLLARFAREIGRADLVLSPEAEQRLLAHAWPGNVRELSNALERAAVLARGATLGAGDIVLDTRGSVAADAPAGADALPLTDAVEAYKLHRIRAALEAAEGNQTRAAELLGMRQPNLSRLMKSLGIR